MLQLAQHYRVSTINWLLDITTKILRKSAKIISFMTEILLQKTTFFKKYVFFLGSFFLDPILLGHPVCWVVFEKVAPSIGLRGLGPKPAQQHFLMLPHCGR
jgi:hypothetical protein